MTNCDASTSERATTLLILESGKHLTLCGHHARKATEQLNNNGHEFTAHDLN